MRGSAWPPGWWDLEFLSSLDLLGDGLRGPLAAPAGDVGREGPGPTPGGDHQDIIRGLHQRPHLLLIAGLDGPGHALRALEVGLGALGVLPDEFSDLLLAPAALGDRPHVLAGEDQRVQRLAYDAAGDPHVVGQRGQDARGRVRELVVELVR